MKFHVRDIEAAAKELRYDEPAQDLRRVLATPVQDFRLPATLSVHVSYYRAGSDLFFHGRVDADVIGTCSRCLEEYVFPFAMDFVFVLVPHQAPGSAGELEEDDANLSYYEGDEVDLSPLLRDQILLALPTRPVCRESCAGLCPQCGTNRNVTACACQTERRESTLTGLAVLRTLKVHS